MPITINIEPIGGDLNAWIGDLLTPQAQSKAIALYGKETLADAQELNKRALGRVPSYSVTVDGRQGAPLESVRPNGSIVIDFAIMPDIVLSVWDLLIENSPEKSGRYKRGHFLIVNNTEIEHGAPIPEASEYILTNREPYSRKIEIGAIKVSVPAGVYERTQQLANKQYGNAVQVLMHYVTRPEGYILQHGKLAGEQLRYPALKISPRG